MCTWTDEIDNANAMLMHVESANSYAGALTVKTVLVCASNGFKRNTQPSGGADASFLAT